MLVLENIVKDYSYSKNIHKALNGVSLKFNNNGFVSILGQSGCGKTTLLNIIGGLDSPTSGNIFVNDKKISEFKASELDSYRNSTIGFIFQNINIIENLTVFENVELSLQLSSVKRKERKKLVYEALDSVGILKLAKKRPTMLSGGERQRVAIARAIINKPKIILADEPTGALDYNTSIEVMNILKKISETCLVIMVTHNDELANRYSDRIIRMLDGKVISDSNETILNDDEEIKIKKVHMPMKVSFLISFKNILSKWIRTIFSSLAGSIGIVAVALVLAVSKGVSIYLNEVQTDALEDYPIIIRSNSITSSKGNSYSNRKRYDMPTSILITNSVVSYEKINNIDPEFLEHINSMDKEYYTMIDENRSISGNLVYYSNGSYQKISLKNFTECINNDDFMTSQYDVIYGKFPTEFNEIALVVDSYNCIDASVLQSLGYSFMDENNNIMEEISFEELVGQKYRLIDNNDYYVRSVTSEGNIKYSVNSYKKMYNASTNDLIITGIIRESENCSFPLYSQGIIYTKKLTDYIIKKANESDIVKEQKQYGYSYRLLSGKPYEESQSLSSSTSIEYQYESDMLQLGAKSQTTRVNIYSQSFENREYIEEYVKSYYKYKKYNNIYYSDYMSSVSKEFSTFIEILTKVLIIFASISLVVSAIMIFIITYISVIERKKEIGLLRSIGARKLDITGIFCSETIFIGLLSGIIGIVLAIFMKMPINNITRNIIKDNLSYKPSAATELVKYNPLTMFILILSSIGITVLAGLVPAIIASFQKPAKVLKGE